MPKSAMDALAAQAVYAARLFERALHDDGPWTMTWGPYEAEATKEVTDAGVKFVATFPETCWLTRPDDTNVILRCRGEVCAVRVISDPGDAAFAVTWELLARRAHVPR